MICAVLLLAAFLPQAETARLAVLRGRVISTAGSPVQGARVRLSSREPNAMPSATSSQADGTFLFQALAPGTYSLYAMKPGYRAAIALPLEVTVQPGDDRVGIDIRMSPPAVITVKIKEPSGEPAVKADVTLYRATWIDGRRAVVEAQAGTTDDRGQFRFHNLAEGSFFIGASTFLPESPVGEVRAEVLRAFYPSAGQLSEALPLKVSSGQEAGPVEVTLKAQRGFSASGHAMNGVSGGACKACIVTVSSLDLMAGFRELRASVNAAGGYIVRGLPPGAYRVSAASETNAGKLVAARIFEISDRDREGVDLVAGPGQTVSGRIVLESPPPTGASIGVQPAPPKLNAGEMRVCFRDQGRFDFSCDTPVWPNLTFEAEDMAAGTYTLDVEPLFPGGYLKALRLAGQILPGREIQLGEQGSLSGLEIVVAFDSSTLSGLVKSGDSTEPLAAQPDLSAVLIPEQGQSPFLRVRSAGIDTNGKFQFDGIAPGAYMLYAVPSSESMECQDPEYRSRFGSFGKRLDLAPGRRDTVELTAVPASH